MAVVCADVEGLCVVVTCEVQTEEGTGDGVTRTGEARADEGETEGSVSDGMRTGGTSTKGTGRHKKGHGSARAVALVARRETRTRERTLTGRVNIGREVKIRGKGKREG